VYNRDDFMPDTLVETTLGLDADIKARLDRLAAARQRPTEGLLRDAIEQYVDREERREKFDRDTLAALAEYEATGLHVTHEEMEAWFARIEAGEDVEPPQPHT
jgi:predicted transcriptional regulator